MGLVRVLYPQPSLAFPFHGVDCASAYLPTGGLSILCCIFNFVCSRKDLLLDLTALPARSFELKERLNILIDFEYCSCQTPRVRKE